MDVQVGDIIKLENNQFVTVSQIFTVKFLTGVVWFFFSFLV